MLIASMPLVMPRNIKTGVSKQVVLVGNATLLAWAGHKSPLFELSQFSSKAVVDLETNTTSRQVDRFSFLIFDESSIII